MEYVWDQVGHLILRYWRWQSLRNDACLLQRSATKIIDPRPDRKVVLLLAEDEAQLQKFTGMLQHEGFVVLSASEEDEALELSRNCSKQIDLLLTDIQLGEGINGIELAKRLLHERKEISVLAMCENPGSARLATERGLPFISKPFTNASLSLRIREVLGMPGRS